METEKTTEIIIPPLRNTTSLQIAPEAKEFSEIARRQLESLSKTSKKSKSKASIDTPSESTPAVEAIAVEVTSIMKPKITEITVISPPQKSNLTSSIVSKAELEHEIRNKVSKDVGTTEIPHEIIMADLETSVCELNNEQEPQLHDQELIDILEGKHEEIELITDDGDKIIVQSDCVNDLDSSSSYHILNEVNTEDDESKRLERDIAIKQIASLPTRKNKRSYFAPATPGAMRKCVNQSKTLVDTLAADWTDEEVLFEVVDLEGNEKESNIKILNMTVIQEATDAPKKSSTTISSPPKILNINASPTEPAASFKRGRVVKKKEIFDNSSKTKPRLLPVRPLAVQLPPSITIKKVTKETIAAQQEKSAAKKGKKRSEIDKLLQDEGAVKMIYSLERENNNQDVPEIEVKPNDESMIDLSEEKNSLITRANAIKNAVLKQSTSPPEVAKNQGRARKRDTTPVKIPEEKKSVKQATKVTPAANAKKKMDDESWDFVYSSRQAQTTCDDAMIIRRRSNSSYSSSAASPRRLSIDAESPRKETKESSFEFTKPPEKCEKSPADSLFKKDFVEELRGKISDVIKNEKTLQLPMKGKKRTAAVAVDTFTTPSKRSSRANGNDHQKLLKVEKNGDIINLILTQSSLTIPLLNELKQALNQFEADETKIVILKSSDEGITGLNYKTLIQTTVDKRKQSASELVTAFK